MNGNQGRVCWNATTRVLTMQGKAALTLGASDKPYGNTGYYGAVAGKTLTLGGSAKFYNDDRAGQAQIPISIVYHRDRYVECTGGAMPSALGTHPDDSC